MVRLERAPGYCRGRLAATLVLGLLLGLPTWAQTYRWVDERGRVHYSDKPPLHAAEPDVLDRQGRLLRKAQPRAPAPSAQDVPHDLARERQDRALLSTYVHEAEIDLARERALAHEKAKQASLEALLEQARARKSRLEAEVAAHRRAGRTPPASLSQSLAEGERELNRLEALHALSVAAAREIHTRYEGYKRRFRELKGLPSEAANAAAPTANGMP